MKGFIKYCIRRILYIIPLALVMCTLIFFLMRLIPGDPAAAYLGPGATVEEIEEISEIMGLDKPLIVQYGIWLGNLFTGDLGQSFHYREPVNEIIFTNIKPTLQIVLISTVISLVIGVALGLISAFKQNSLVDRFIVTLTTAMMAVPFMWLALVLILLFGVVLRWLPVAGYRTFAEGGLESIKFLVLPVIAIAITQIGILARVVRSRMADVLHQDYILTAKAKGLPVWTILIKHAFRNTLITVLTVTGMMLAAMIGGAVIIEIIFAIPGMGRLFVQAITRRDYAIIQGGMIVIVIAYLVINFIVDILYAVVDPRVSYGSERR
ncbi:MAG: Glutathione transport system permease protein GsiC [Syntrophomonadaceae bacterium]|nr:Glutathione transport system permease protein GsiC [Bacillota bacterium]